jgi:hypothetical protein
MKLRPLHDRVVVKRLEEEMKTAGGIIIPDTAALEGLFGLLAHLEKTLSPAQRQHAAERLRGYARDFQVLAEAR